MGLEIKKNEKGLYNVSSSISGEMLHDEPWITEEHAKRVLIERAFSKFIDATIAIDLDFPKTYYVNDELPERSSNFPKYWLENYQNSNHMIEKYNEIIERIKPDLNTREEE